MQRHPVRFFSAHSGHGATQMSGESNKHLPHETVFAGIQWVITSHCDLALPVLRLHAKYIGCFNLRACTFSMSNTSPSYTRSFRVPSIRLSYGR
nr:hypothetical protein PsAHV6-039 [Psittacid alphaherpesvirus 6]